MAVTKSGSWSLDEPRPPEAPPVKPKPKPKPKREYERATEYGSISLEEPTPKQKPITTGSTTPPKKEKGFDPSKIPEPEITVTKEGVIIGPGIAIHPSYYQHPSIGTHDLGKTIARRTYERTGKVPPEIREQIISQIPPGELEHIRFLESQHRGRYVTGVPGGPYQHMEKVPLTDIYVKSAYEQYLGIERGYARHPYSAYMGEAYKGLSLPLKKEYGFKYTDWGTIPVGERKQYLGAEKYFETMSEEEKQKLITEFMGTGKFEKMEEHEWIPAISSLFVKPAPTPAVVGAYLGTKAQREKAWQQITLTPYERRELHYLTLPISTRLTSSLAHSFAGYAVWPVTFPQFVVKQVTGKQLGPEIAKGIEEYFPGGPRGGIQSWMAEARSQLHGQGFSYEMEQAKKYPLEMGFATFGEVSGIWAGGKALGLGVKGVKLGVKQLKWTTKAYTQPSVTRLSGRYFLEEITPGAKTPWQPMPIQYIKGVIREYTRPGTYYLGQGKYIQESIISKSVIKEIKHISKPMKVPPSWISKEVRVPSDWWIRGIKPLSVQELTLAPTSRLTKLFGYTIKETPTPYLLGALRPYVGHIPGFRYRTTEIIPTRTVAEMIAPEMIATQRLYSDVYRYLPTKQTAFPPKPKMWEDIMPSKVGELPVIPFKRKAINIGEVIGYRYIGKTKPFKSPYTYKSFGVEDIGYRYIGGTKIPIPSKIPKYKSYGVGDISYRYIGKTKIFKAPYEYKSYGISDVGYRYITKLKPLPKFKKFKWPEVYSSMEAYGIPSDAFPDIVKASISKVSKPTFTTIGGLKIFPTVTRGGARTYMPEGWVIATGGVPLDWLEWLEEGIDTGVHPHWGKISLPTKIQVSKPTYDVGTRFDVGIKYDVGTRQLLSLKSASESITKNLLDTKGLLQEKGLERDVIDISAVESAQTNLLSQAQLQLQSQLQTQAQMQKLELTSLLKLDLLTITPTPPIELYTQGFEYRTPEIKQPRIPRFPFLTLPSGAKKGIVEKPGQGYAVYVKDRYIVHGKKKFEEKYIKLSKVPLSKRHALGFGGTIVNQSAAASFFIKPIAGVPQKSTISFTNWNLLKHMFYKRKNVLTERTAHRINTYGEVMEIPARGWVSQRRKLQPKTIKSLKRIKVTQKPPSFGRKQPKVSKITFKPTDLRKEMQKMFRRF